MQLPGLDPLNHPIRSCVETMIRIRILNTALDTADGHGHNVFIMCKGQSMSAIPRFNTATTVFRISYIHLFSAITPMNLVRR